MSDSKSNTPTIAVGVRLLGKPVRYQGSRKHDRFITDHRSQTLDFIPVCREVEAGAGVPRPTIHLRRIGGELRLTRSDDGDIHFTDQMAEVALKRAQELQGRISGLMYKEEK